MPLIYRRDLDRPLTFEEMDGNLEYLDRYAEDVEVVVTHIDEISDVATSINGVNAVAGSLPSVVATSLHLDEIDTVAGDTTNIGTVAGLSSEITAVAGAVSSITAVAGSLPSVVATSLHLDEIDTVAGDTTNIGTVAGLSSEITAVAGAVSSITAVAADLSNIDDVAGDLTDINTVAGISASVSTVAGISSSVSTVAGSIDNVNATGNAIGDVETVAASIADVITCADNIDAIIDAPIQANAAAAARIASEAARDQTLAAFDNFDDRYLGTKTSDPTTDNDGNPLIAGALYFNSVLGVMKVYTGTVWVAAYASLEGALLVANNLSDLSDAATARLNIGLGNVTNESKATMFDDSAFTGDTTIESLQFTGGTGTQGTMTWNADEETLDLIQNGATLQLGQKLQTHCRNDTASSIANATVVMATGTIGASGRITIAPWDGATDVKFIVGITTEVIAAGTDGKVTTFGKVRDVDTSLITGTFTTGVIYARRDGTGGLTYTKPDAKAVPLAFLIANETSDPANNGTIMVRVTPVDEITLEHAETAYGWGNHASAGYASASTVSSHISNTSNPHSVTATQVGLGNVTNESKATMFTSPTFTGNAVLGSPASGNFSTGTFTWPTFNQNTSGNAATATSAGNADTLDGYHASSFQATLVSGTNIKTVGGTSLLGSGDVAVSAFPSGTAMLFAQTAAPTGWTKSTTHDNKALRVVSGTAGSGGSTAFTSVFASRTPSGSVSSISGTVGATTLSTAQMPSHTHLIRERSLSYNSNGIFVTHPNPDTEAYGGDGVYSDPGVVQATGGNGSHTHSFSGSGSLSMNAMDFSVQYVDVIIATKD